MRTALDVSRWLLLIPAYLMLTAFFSVWVLEFFIHDPEIWHEHFDVVLFSCSVLESIALCLACALLAPSIKRLIGILAAAASVVLTLNRWSFILATQGLTRPCVGELAAEIVGGIVAFMGLGLIHFVRVKRVS